MSGGRAKGSALVLLVVGGYGLRAPSNQVIRIAGNSFCAI